MNNVERLAELAGSRTELAAICGVDRSLVTRWAAPVDHLMGRNHGHGGHVPTKFNNAIRAWAVNQRPRFEDADKWFAFYEGVKSCLDPDACPTCGRAYSDEDDGRVA